MDEIGIVMTEMPYRRAFSILMTQFSLSIFGITVTYLLFPM